MMSFKQGAFVGERTVRPHVMKFSWGCGPEYTYSCNFKPLLILMLSWIWTRTKIEIQVMPDFTPNEYLFTKHFDKGKHRANIYAWAIRQAMIECGEMDPTVYYMR